MTNDPEQGALSVSQAMEIAKEALESFTLTLIGEVSEVNDKRGYAAVYFTLKDDKATMPCMMWKGRYGKQDVRLAVGMLVKVTGRFTVYAPKGRMNFDVFGLSLAGEGELRLRVANLAKKLEAEGLTSDRRKRAIPKYCERIGLVTSPRGAAVHDVLRTLRRRFPVARVLFAGVPVEGADAPKQLIRALSAVADAGAEVILLVRGGGSFEDLMPFNDESLARAIAASPVPVVTGIGHEPDTSIADMVADLRASTPTGAAEAISAKQENLQQGFHNAEHRMAVALDRQLKGCRMELEAWAGRPIMRDSHALLATDAQRLDSYADKLGSASRTLLPSRRQQMEGLADRLARAIPQNLKRDQGALSSYRTLLLSRGRMLLRDEQRLVSEADNALCSAMEGRMESEQGRVSDLQQRLGRKGGGMLIPFEHAFGLAASRLEDLSPLAVIRRGYAMARDEDGRVIDSVSKAAVGQHIAVSVSDGRMDCTVDRIDQTEIVLVEEGK
ncbi:MAG: exodeoxyribonuclease VII large subunit [Eggerthellaceae bacterium]|jgi:exodeoxyribonuclease VII large subunit